MLELVRLYQLEQEDADIELTPEQHAFIQKLLK